MRVEADATWGVTITFGMASSGLSGAGGSCSSTSRPADCTLPLRSASMRSASWMMGPRAVFTITTPSFICAKAAAFRLWRVSSLSGEWTLM